MTPPVAFYCISSDLYFPGAVALVNSLRLVGHTEPIFLLDCGLSDAHRELLATEVTHRRNVSRVVALICSRRSLRLATRRRRWS